MSRKPSITEVYRQVRPIYEAAAEKLPPAEAIRVAEFVVTWRFLRSYDGQPPTAQRHSEALDVSRATYFRRKESFRRAFPDAESPADVHVAEGVALPTLQLALRLG